MNKKMVLAACAFAVVLFTMPGRALAWSMWLSEDTYEECVIREIQKYGIENDAMAREIIRKCTGYPSRTAPYGSSGLFGSRTAGNCILKNGKSVHGKLGSRLLTMACYRTYPKQ